MKIVLAGGTGWIGNHFTELLLKKGHDVIILTRNEKTDSDRVKYVKWLGEERPEEKIGNPDCVINLAGISINQGRWTKRRKEQILKSRLHTTKELVRIIRALPKKPEVFINASAIGIYPPSEQAVYTEKSTEQATNFLGKTVQAWEKQASVIQSMNIRTVFARFGIVLGKDGGAFPLIVLPYRLFVGGKIGSGKQWMSWIHIKDTVRALLFMAENENIQGSVNVTAPNPVRMADFGKMIAQMSDRPHWFPVPAVFMKAILGEKSTLVLEGQRVLPEKLTEHGFSFVYPDFASALKNLLSTE